MYASRQDMLDRYGRDEMLELSDRTGAGGLDGAVIDRALADASALANSYLSQRYRLPVAPAPPLLTRLTADIARHMLHVDNPPEVVVAAYKAAVAHLAAIAGGRADLDAAGLVATGAAGAAHRGPGPGRVDRMVNNYRAGR